MKKNIFLVSVVTSRYQKSGVGCLGGSIRKTNFQKIKKMTEPISRPVGPISRSITLEPSHAGPVPDRSWRLDTTGHHTQSFLPSVGR
jgi:hypothetical protein